MGRMKYRKMVSRLGTKQTVWDNETKRDGKLAECTKRPGSIKKGFVLIELLVVLMLLCLIPLYLFGVPHLVIWVAKELFSINWSDKYWAVFFFLFIVSAFFGSTKR